MSSKNLNSKCDTCESSPLNENQIGKKTSKDYNYLEENLKGKLNELLLLKKPRDIHYIIADILDEIIADNFDRTDALNKNCFYMTNPPNLSFRDFLKRVLKYLNPEFSTIILSLIYLDNFLNNNEENIYLTENNIFKLYLASIVLSFKYNEDYFDNNKFFAKVGGVSLQEMNKLEREFLRIMDYKLYVQDELFEVYLEHFIECEN